MADNFETRDGSDYKVTLAAKAVPGGALMPQSIPSSETGVPYGANNPLPVSGAARNAIKDSTGALFYPDDCAVTAVTRDTAGNLLTTTISDGTTSWVQTITRDASGNMSALSKWERQ